MTNGFILYLAQVIIGEDFMEIFLTIFIICICLLPEVFIIRWSLKKAK